MVFPFAGLEIISLGAVREVRAGGALVADKRKTKTRRAPVMSSGQACKVIAQWQWRSESMTSVSNREKCFAGVAADCTLIRCIHTLKFHRRIYIVVSSTSSVSD